VILFLETRITLLNAMGELRRKVGDPNWKSFPDKEVDRKIWDQMLDYVNQKRDKTWLYPSKKFCKMKIIFDDSRFVYVRNDISNQRHNFLCSTKVR